MRWYGQYDALSDWLNNEALTATDNCSGVTWSNDLLP